MKRFHFLFSGALILGLLMYSACKQDDGGDIQETAAEKQLNLLSGTWSASAGSVTRDATAEPTYDNFTVTFSGSLNSDKSNVESSSTYNTNDVTNAFPSGTWTFNGSNVNQILRGTGITMTIQSISETNLTLAFSLNADGSTNKTAGLEGAWVFTLTK
jgi:hypothetical protein